jgi:hypothetical protein
MRALSIPAGFVPAVLLILCCVPALPQSEKGSILGTVRDASGAAVANIVVKVTNTASNVTQELLTNEDGAYEAPFLSPGEYSVSVSATGFDTAVISGIVVHVGDRVRADISLQVGKVETRVEVKASEPLVQTGSASIGQVFENRSIQDLPNGDRNIYNYVQLSSTAVPTPGGNAPGFRLESGGSLALSGTRPSSLTFKIDGLSNTDPAFGTPTITPSLDAVQEFRVQNNAYDAQYEGIAQINVATKSGVNSFHGSAFDFLRNDAFQPRNPLNPPDSSGLPAKNKLRFNQFGATFGGPVRLPKLYNGSNRTFFFFSFEGRRENLTGTGFTRVPTAAERSGNFADDLGGCATAKLNGVDTPIPLLGTSGAPTGNCVRVGQIFNPATTISNPAFNASQAVSAFNPQFIRQPFAANQIPSSSLASLTQKALSFQLPLPNNPGSVESNYVGSAGLVYDYNQYSGRLDHVFSESDRVYGRVAFQDNVRLNQALIPYTGKDLANLGRVASATWTHMFNPSFINELRLGYVRGIYGDSIQTVDPGTFGFKNTFGKTLPQFRLTATQLIYGGFAGSVLQEIQNTYQLADNVSLLLGQHGLKFGFEIDHNRFKNGDLGSNANGVANFSGLYSIANPLATANFANSMADWLLGVAQSTSLTTPSIAFLRNTPWGAYVQDDWKVTRWATLNLGVRYQYYQPYLEENRGGITFDYENGGHVLVVDKRVADFANSPLVRCCAPRRLVEGDKTNFAPRIGLAIRPFKSDNFAIRAGYGIFYSPTTQFFVWSQYQPALLPSFNGVTGDFQHPAATIDNLYPSSQFSLGGSLTPVFPAGVNRAVLNNQPIIGASGVGSYRTPYTQQWSLSLQRSFAGDFLVDLSYTGSNSKRLPTQWIFNQPSASPVPVDFQSTDAAANPYLRRPYSNFSLSTFAVTNILQANYNAATVKVDKRFGHGFALLSSYTFSKSLDQGSEVFALANTFNILSNNRDINQDRGVSTFNIPHRWVTSGLIELPFGRGKRWLNAGGLMDALAGGFQFSGIFTLESGFPFTPLIRNRLSNTGYSLATERGDLVGNPYWSDSQWSQMVRDWETKDVPLYVINPKSIDINYAPGTFGNIPRNFFHAPYGRSLDLGVQKNLRFGEATRLTLRADMYNVTQERLHRLDLASNVYANNLLTNPLVGSIPARKFFFNPHLIQLGMRLEF